MLRADDNRRDLQATPVHASLVRPILLAGVERELAVMEVVAGTLLFGLLGLSLATLVAVGLLVLAHLALIPASAADPHMFKLYLRHITYRPYYPAQPRLTSAPARVPLGR